MENELVVISLDKYNELYQANQTLNDIYDIILSDLEITCLGSPSLNVNGELKLLELVMNKNLYIQTKFEKMKEGIRDE